MSDDGDRGQGRTRGGVDGAVFHLDGKEPHDVPARGQLERVSLEHALDGGVHTAVGEHLVRAVDGGGGGERG